MVMRHEGHDESKHHLDDRPTSTSWPVVLSGVDTATCKARSKSSDARSKAGILLMGPEEAGVYATWRWSRGSTCIL